MNRSSPGTSVRILGEEFRVTGASPERVHALAEAVEHRFQELMAARPTMDFKRLAVAVCLNFAEELYDERSRRETMDGISVRVRRCREALDLVCAGQRPRPGGEE